MVFPGTFIMSDIDRLDGDWVAEQIAVKAHLHATNIKYPFMMPQLCKKTNTHNTLH